LHLNAKILIFEISICILKVSSAAAELPTSVEPPPPPPPPHLPSFGVTVLRYFRHLVSHLNNWKDVWSVRCIV
jgi:hypothetical protein